MRNLKKLLAVVLTVVMIASMMVPALAANTYEAEALKLQSIGMFAGEPADLKLEEGVTRIQGLAFAIRAAGKEADAFAMTDEEVATILAGYLDGADVPAWGRKYAAYAIKNGITVGVSATEKKFAALDPISGTSFLVFLMKAGMGYADVTTANVVEASVTAGILTAGQAAGFGAKAALIRDDAAGILFGAAMNGVNADGTYLIEALIASGFVDADAALAAGFVVEVVPEDLEVVSVEADNLIQAVVTFNQPVDKDTATDVENYDFATADKITVSEAALSEDGTSVTLTFAAKVAQQKEAKLTVSGVKTVDGTVMKKSTTEVYFLDNTIPTIVSAEVVGISSIKVVFSEPMNPTTVVNASFKVNDGKYYVKNVIKQKNDTEAVVELYTSLKNGDLPFEVKVGPADHAGFTAMGLTTTLTVSEDKDAPVVVGYKDAKPNSVVLVWDEDVVLTSGGGVTSNFYHTNSSNPIAATLTSTEIDGNEMTLTFATANKLPNGTAYVYVLKEAVQDRWNNKNAQQMTKIEVEVDNEAPVLQSIEVKSEKQIQLVFDEVVTKANVKANYKVLDKDGKEVSNTIASFNLATAKKVTITFTKNFDGGDYTLVIKDVEDAVGNDMNSTTMEFTITDKTPPVASTDFAAKLYIVAGSGSNFDQILKVSFDQAMATEGAYSIADLSKYVLTTGGAIEDLDDVTIEVVDDGKAVEIVIPNTSLVVTTGAGQLKIGRVADVAGNYTVLLENIIAIGTPGNITIEKAELTGPKEVKVYFSSELSIFEADELLFTNGGPVSTVTTELVKGKTVATYTLSTALAYDASNLAITTANPTGANVTANSYGETLVKNTAVVTKVDKLAPAIEKITIGSDDDIDNVVTVDANNDGILESIKITYTEALLDSFNLNSFEVEGHKVTGVTYASNVVTIALNTTLDDNDDPLVPAWDQTPVVTQLVSIFDAPANNELKPASETVSSLDRANPVALTATENADAKVITITFSEALDATTVVAGNFTGTAGTPTVSYVPGSTTVTLTYTAALVDTNTIIVGVGVKDDSTTGNAAVTATFTRGAQAAGAGVYTKAP